MEMRISNASDFTKLGDFLEKVATNNSKGVMTFVKGQGKVACYLDSGAMGTSIADIRVEGIPVLENMLETSKKLGIEKEKMCTGVFHYILSEPGFSGTYMELSSLPPITSPWNVNFQMVLMNLVKEYDECQEFLTKVKEKKIKVRPHKIPKKNVELTISERQWPVFVGICEGNLKNSMFATADIELNISTLNFLQKSGLIELVEEGEIEEDMGRPLSPEFEEKLREFLVDAIGPFGELMVDEAKEAAGIETLTTNNWYLFIEELKSRIDSDCTYKGRSCKDIVEELVRKYL